MGTKFTKRDLSSATAIVIYLMILKFVFHIITGWQYGLFNDELYYFSMSNHLDFGYVDVTPITAWLMALSRWLLGDSIHAMHVFPALAGSFTIFFAARTTRVMGGGRFAQCLTALAVMMAPALMAVFSMFIYDAFDHLMSAVVVFVAARILSGKDSPKNWVLFGIVIGIGVMIKITLGFMVLALAAGLLFTQARRYFAKKWFWISAAIAVACFIPYLIWQWTRGFPIANYLLFYTGNRTIYPSAGQLFLNLWISMNPLAILLWLGGLIFLFTKRGRQYRAFAWAFLFYFALSAIMYIKFYALSGLMLSLTAFGSVCLENNYRDCSMPSQLPCVQQKGKRKLSNALKAAYIAFLCAVGVIFAPLAVPMLSPEDTAAYQQNVGIFRYIKWDIMPSTGIPSLHSSRLGWEELAQTVAGIYHALPDDDRKECSILCMNYAEAGAIDYYSEKYAIPQSISGHLSHYYWGYDGYNGKCLIIIGLRYYTVPSLKYVFEEVSVEKGPNTKYASSYENDVPIYICKGLKKPLDEFWESVRSVQ